MHFSNLWLKEISEEELIELPAPKYKKETHAILYNWLNILFSTSYSRNDLKFLHKDGHIDAPCKRCQPG